MRACTNHHASLRSRKRVPRSSERTLPGTDDEDANAAPPPLALPDRPVARLRAAVAGSGQLDRSELKPLLEKLNQQLQFNNELIERLSNLEAANLQQAR